MHTLKERKNHSVNKKENLSRHCCFYEVIHSLSAQGFFDQLPSEHGNF